MTKFEGKVALVTGAASGVGRATARQMVDQGAKVYGIDINKEGLEMVAGELRADFKSAVCDISNREASRAAVAECVTTFGKLDIVANIAGVVKSHHVTDVDEATWRLIMGVN